MIESIWNTVVIRVRLLIATCVHHLKMITNIFLRLSLIEVRTITPYHYSYILKDEMTIWMDCTITIIRG